MNSLFVELGLVFPEELAAVHDAAVAQVEQIDGDQRRLGVAGEDVGIVALGGGHLLALFHLFDGGEQIAERGGFLEARALRRPLAMRVRSWPARSRVRPSRKSPRRARRSAYSSSVVSPATQGPWQRWM